MKLMIRLNQNCIHFRMIKYEFGIDNSIVYSKSLFVFIFICPAEMWYLTAKLDGMLVWKKICGFVHCAVE